MSRNARVDTGNLPEEAAVLAGGRGLRMGKMGAEKALLEVGGQSLLERSLQVLGNRFRRLLVSVPHEGPSEGVKRVVERGCEGGVQIHIVSDRRPGRLGPLAAIESILSAIEGPGVFVIAVDVPTVQRELVDTLLRLAREPGRLGIMPCWKGNLEPLYGVYNRALLPLVSELLDGGERRAQSLADQPGVDLLQVGKTVESARHDEAASGHSEFVTDESPESIFLNLNTPGELGNFRRQQRL